MPTPRRARSKSPGPRTRSSKKSPGAHGTPIKSSGGDDSSSPLDDANVQMGIGLAILVGLCVHKNGMPSSPQDFLTDFFGTFAGDIDCCKWWPFGLLLTGHVLNCCQNAGDGFWVGSLANAAMGSFASVMIVDFVNGNRSSILADEGNMTLVALCWYFCNHDVPFTGTNVWNLITSKAGPCLQNFLDLCTTLFVTKQVLAAAATASTAGPFGFAVFTPMFMALVAGAAGNFFPLDKGINIDDCTAEVYSALAIGAYVVFLPVLKANPVCGSLISTVHEPLSGFVGGNDVIAAVMINALFGKFIPFNPVEMVTDALQKVTGV